MYININSDNNIICVNTDKITAVEYDKKYHKTIIHFEKGFTASSSGKNVFDSLTANLMKE